MQELDLQLRYRTPNLLTIGIVNKIIRKDKRGYKIIIMDASDGR